ncbi:hypothetical protein HG535_0D06260 [Zygotorulaspora mrakii]|uniref:Aminotransferase class I/classII large domain-containing protein n=1 Tax=Zygotorulaspora mrakii TaxID=42260 RepID=A0A7H9B350_ZYGMR|nr:uncharacterized protein HG535_0D06260 [Zygotorulaspora mrakii]QLG72917.1 hypothetical protein HG535_0D06260 [Zygotorulaspora mrakii]
MPYQELFAVERFMDAYEECVSYNLGETCCHSLSLNDFERITGERVEFDRSVRFTYGSIKGSHGVRSRVASLYSSEDIELNKDNVLITNGAIGANFLVNYALAGPGDHVICVAPTYQQLSSVPRMFGAEVDLLDLEASDDFLPNIEKLKVLVRPTTTLIVINNPNNPLGCVIPPHVLKQISDLAADLDIHVLCDEVYSPLFHSCDTTPSLCQMNPKAIITGSMSKAFSAAGLRLGWVVSQDKHFLSKAASRRDYNTISVSIIDDFVSQYILKNYREVLKHNLKLCRENLSVLNDFVNENADKFSFYNIPVGGAVCLIKIHGVSDTFKFCSKLAEKHRVLCVPGETFGKPGTIRIGYGNSKEELLSGLPLLKQAYTEWFDEA